MANAGEYDTSSRPSCRSKKCTSYKSMLNYWEA